MSKQDLFRILSSAPEALQAHFKAASVRACEAPTPPTTTTSLATTYTLAYCLRCFYKPTIERFCFNKAV